MNTYVKRIHTYSGTIYDCFLKTLLLNGRSENKLWFKLQMRFR